MATGIQTRAEPMSPIFIHHQKRHAAEDPNHPDPKQRRAEPPVQFPQVLNQRGHQHNPREIRAAPAGN